MASLQTNNSASNASSVSVTLEHIAGFAPVIDFIMYTSRLIPTGGLNQLLSVTSLKGYTGNLFLFSIPCTAGGGGGFTIMFPDGTGPKLYNAGSACNVVCGVIDSAGAYVSSTDLRLAIGYHHEPL